MPQRGVGAQAGGGGYKSVCFPSMGPCSKFQLRALEGNRDTLSKSASGSTPRGHGKLLGEGGGPRALVCSLLAGPRGQRLPFFCVKPLVSGPAPVGTEMALLAKPVTPAQTVTRNHKRPSLPSPGMVFRPLVPPTCTKRVTPRAPLASPLSVDGPASSLPPQDPGSHGTKPRGDRPGCLQTAGIPRAPEEAPGAGDQRRPGRESNRS